MTSFVDAFLLAAFAQGLPKVVISEMVDTLYESIHTGSRYELLNKAGFRYICDGLLLCFE